MSSYKMNTIHWVHYEDHVQQLCKAMNDSHLYTDVILRVEEKDIKCHKYILSVASGFLGFVLESFRNNPEVPVIILPEVRFDLIQAVVDFFYTGEIILNTNDINELWDLAAWLDIKSLKSTLSGLLQSLPSNTNEQKLLLDDSSLNDIIKDIQENIPEQEVEFGILQEVELVEYVLTPSTAVDKTEVSGLTINTATASPNFLRKIAPNTQQKVNLVPTPQHSAERVLRPKLKRIAPRLEEPPQSPKKLKITKIESKATEDDKQPKPVINLLNSLRLKSLEFQANLEKAVIACKNGKSLEEASRQYKIPKETIWRNVKNFKLAHIKEL